MRGITGWVAFDTDLTTRTGVVKAMTARRGIDRILDLYHWYDLYRPTFELA